MKNIKVLLLLAIITLSIFLLSGCWNYKEIEQLAIVSGVAIDKDDEDSILITVEIVSVQQSDKGSRLHPVYVETSGTSFFDAARKLVTIQGKKLYWSHAKAVIIGEALAKENISKVLDFINRDAEIREDMWILVAKGRKASEIFKAKPYMEKMIAFEFDDTLRAQKAVSKFPAVELYEFIDLLASKYTAAVLPAVTLIEADSKLGTRIGGTAIIKGDKLIGYLDDYESKSLLWIKDELKGGLFVVTKAVKTDTNVSLEIYRSKTKVTPEIIDSKPAIKIALTVDANIGEIMGTEDFISHQGRVALEKEAEKQIKKNITSLIDKSQKKYNTDIFGFGETIKRSMPKVWKGIEGQWSEIFPDLESRVDVDVRIRGSATTRKPIVIGE